MQNTAVHRPHNLPHRVLRGLAALVATTTLMLTVAGAAAETVTIHEGRRVAISVPDDWKYSSGRDDTGITSVRVANEPETVVLQVSFIPDPQSRMALREVQMESLEELAREFVGSSVEKEVRAEPLEPVRGTGLFAVFTDERLVDIGEMPPGEFLHATTGIKSSAGWFAVFTLFSKDAKSADHQRALNLMRTSFNSAGAPRLERDPRAF